MKNRINRKYVASGLAIALILGGAFTIPSITPLSNSELNLIVEAEETGEIKLDESYLNLSDDGNILYSFSDDGMEKFKSEIAEKGYKFVKISFSDDIKAKEISNGFNTSFSIDGVSFHLTLPDSIEVIHKESFMHNNISSITFGSSIKKIEEMAFYKAGLNTDIVLPEGLEELGESCFFNNKITGVTLPSTLTKGGVKAFEHNKIETVNFPEDYNLVGTLKDEYRPQLGKITGKIIPDYMFVSNKIKKINFPKGIVGIGAMAFARNNLQELSIPASVKTIYSSAFDSVAEGYNGSTNTIKNLIFEIDADGNGVEKIGHGAFYFAGIEGHVSFPKSTTYIDDCTFMGNRITKISFNGSAPAINSLIVYGSDSFGDLSVPPIETIEDLNSSDFQIWTPEYLPGGEGVFRETKHLKNVSFNYANLHDNFTEIPTKAFYDGKLKSINFPEKIKKISKDAFELNSGWYDGTNKVALYRVGTDGKTYVINDDLKDGDHYVVNPVLFKLVLKDQYGNPLSDTYLPKNIRAEITRNGATTTYTDIANIDLTHFKLGDKVKFTLPATPAGYDFIGVAEQTGLTKINDTEYEVSLDPADTNAIKDISYDDSYKVGYKSAVIELKYRTQPSGPVVPSEPDTPTDPTTPSEPTPNTPEQPKTNVEEPKAPQENLTVDDNDTPQGNTDTTDISDDDTPQGSIDTTDISDDDTPQGNAKIIADGININDTKSPLGTLPQTGGTSGNLLTLLGGLLIGIGIVIKKKFM